MNFNLINIDFKLHKKQKYSIDLIKTRAQVIRDGVLRTHKLLIDLYLSQVKILYKFIKVI